MIDRAVAGEVGNIEEWVQQVDAAMKHTSRAARQLDTSVTELDCRKQDSIHVLRRTVGEVKAKLDAILQRAEATLEAEYTAVASLTPAFSQSQKSRWGTGRTCCSNSTHPRADPRRHRPQLRSTASPSSPHKRNPGHNEHPGRVPTNWHHHLPRPSPKRPPATPCCIAEQPRYHQYAATTTDYAR